MKRRWTIVAAAVLVCASAGLVVQRVGQADAPLADGTVVGHVERAGAHHPIVRLRDGRRATAARAFELGDDPLFRVGDRVAVRTDPGRPGIAHIETTFGRWGLPVLAALAAVLALAAGLRRKVPAAA